MKYQYEAAISFAGENREFAEAVATSLRQKGVEIFYDSFYASELWGEDLSVKLREIYYAESRYCIMILSEHYIQKMWTSFERQQAIERLIGQNGRSYILPVRLDSFKAEVPGLSNLIGYLSVRSNEPQKVVNHFLQKIGKQVEGQVVNQKPSPVKSNIPKLKKSYSDREKNTFLKQSFDHMVATIEGLAIDTHKRYPHFEYELERITSRKVLFTLYNNDDELTRFKIWLGGGFGEHTISIYHGKRIDVDSDSTTNEIIYQEEHEGELKLRPLGMPMVGGQRDKFMSQQEAAEYIWQIVCRQFSY